MKDMSRVQKKKVAVVQCAGGCRRQTEVGRPAGNGYQTEGSGPAGNGCQTEESGPAENGCQQILETKADAVSCEYGCLGGGSCVAACRLHAVYINARGAAEVDPEKCAGCGLCAKACPIRISIVEYNIYPACVSEDAGAQTRKETAIPAVSPAVSVSGTVRWRQSASRITTQ